MVKEAREVYAYTLTSVNEGSYLRVYKNDLLVLELAQKRGTDHKVGSHPFSLGVEMAQRRTYLTPEGLSKLEVELGHLKTAGRQDVADRIQRAKEVGGTVDNAEYDEAKKEQSFIEGRVLALEAMVSTAAIIDSLCSPCIILLNSE